MTVDSREAFELLADKDYAAVNRLTGWGVLSWITNGTLEERARIRLCVVTDGGALYVVRTKPFDGTPNGAIVYGSTREIVDSALDLAEIEKASVYAIKTGVVYYAQGDTFYRTKEPALKFAEPEWKSWLEDYEGRRDSRAYEPYRGAHYSGTPYSYRRSDGALVTYSDGKTTVKYDAEFEERLEREASGHLFDVIEGGVGDEDSDGGDDNADEDGETGPARVVDAYTGEDDESKDWWRELEESDDFDRASFLRAMGEDKL
jgi:hypothetical protein